MKSIEITARKVDDAIKEGLTKLGTTFDNVDIEILSQGGLFKKAKIRMTMASDSAGEFTKQVREDIKFSSPEKITTPRPDKPVPQQNPQSADRIQSQASVQNDNRHKPPVREERTGPAQGQKPAQGQPRNQPERQSADKNAPRHQEKQRQDSRPQPQNNQRIDKENRDNKRPDNNRHEGGEKKRAAKDITPEVVAAAEEFVRGMLEKMDAKAGVKATVKEDYIYVDILSEGATIIGYRGETLDAIEYITSIFINKNRDEYFNVVVDSCNYRNKREKVLVDLADKMAQKCIKTGRRVIMEPMNRSGRKIVHSTLGKYDNILTKSEGIEPNRHIVIFFKKDKKN